MKKESRVCESRVAGQIRVASCELRVASWKYFLRLMLFGIIFLFAHDVFAQKERGYVRQGNQKFSEGKFEEAEDAYNKALDVKNDLPEGVFNLGDVAYQKKDYEKAAEQFETAALLAKDNNVRAKAYHNLGNTHLQAGQYEKSIDAYKQALRLIPADADTKYNLAYAKEKLIHQQQQQQQNQKDQEPSEYAKLLKKKAEALVRQYKYSEALDLMKEGLRKDQTVAAFNDFIKKINDVVDVVQ